MHPTHHAGLWRVLRLQLAAYEAAGDDALTTTTTTTTDGTTTNPTAATAAAAVAGTYSAHDAFVLDVATAAKFARLAPLLRWVRLADLRAAAPRYPHLQGLALDTRVISDLSLPPVGGEEDAVAEEGREREGDGAGVVGGPVGGVGGPRMGEAPREVAVGGVLVNGIH